MNLRYISGKKGCIFKRHYLSLLLLSLLFSGCSYHNNNISYFNMLEPGKGTLANKRAAEKFWSSVRPVTTLSASHYKLGRYYQKSGKYDKAIAEFSKALRNDNNFCKAYNGVAMSYDALGNCEMARNSYDQAIECAPQEAYLFNNYACSSLLCGEYQKAITLLTKAENLSADNKRIKNNLRFAHSVYDEISHMNSVVTNEIQITQDDLVNNRLPEEKDVKYASALMHEIPKLVSGKPSTSGIDVSLLINSNTFKNSAKPLTPQAQNDIVANIETSQTRINDKPTEVTRRTKTNERLGTEIASSPNFVPPVLKIVPDKTKKVVGKKHLERPVNSTADAIEVFNGNGISGMAGRSADYFRNQGFKISRITNAENFNFEESVIFYREGYLQLAKEIARVMPGAQNLEKVSSFEERIGIGVRILLGEDMVRMQFPHGYVFKSGNSSLDKQNLITSTINVGKLQLSSAVLFTSS